MKSGVAEESATAIDPVYLYTYFPIFCISIGAIILGNLLILSFTPQYLGEKTNFSP